MELMMNFKSIFGTAIKKLVRRNDPQTSFDAAVHLDTTKTEKLVYETIKGFPDGCISDDVVTALPGLAHSTVTSRYRALITKGLIEVNGTRPGKSGRQQRIMKAIK
jgi:hypothetical protein